jgi:plastocyanin
MKPGGYFPIVSALGTAALRMAVVLGMSAPAHAATIRIAMQNLVIEPAAASARVGDAIEWVNKDILAHTATARNGDWDVTLPPNRTVKLVLKKAGTIDYYCRFHPNMKATLTVSP